MRLFSQRFRWVTPLLVLVMACPAWSAPGIAEGLQAADVALTPDGLLVGQLVDAQGKPLADASVWLYSEKLEPLRAETNARGQFAYRGVEGGVYYLQAGDQLTWARVWPAKMAPPSARSAVLLVGDTTAVRGQTAAPEGVNSFVRGAKRTFTNPLAVAAVVGAAVAIPVAVHNADSGS